MNRYWFKPKRYGYGATPVSWEGWLVTGLAVAIIFVSSLTLVGQGRPNPIALVIWLAIVSATVVGLSIVGRRKTDGAWRWRWGSDR